MFVVDKDGKAEYREVKLGPVVDGLRVVKAGLKPGEKIVVNGLQRVRPGVADHRARRCRWSPPRDAGKEGRAAGHGRSQSKESTL